MEHTTPTTTPRPGSAHPQTTEARECVNDDRRRVQFSHLWRRNPRAIIGCLPAEHHSCAVALRIEPSRSCGPRATSGATCIAPDPLARRDHAPQSRTSARGQTLANHIPYWRHCVTCRPACATTSPRNRHGTRPRRHRPTSPPGPTTRCAHCCETAQRALRFATGTVPIC